MKSAVIGVPHPDFGEAVIAVVVADTALQPADIIATARSQLAGFKAPKQVFIVDALPRNTMAKVQKNILRDTYQELYQ